MKHRWLPNAFVAAWAGIALHSLSAAEPSLVEPLAKLRDALRVTPAISCSTSSTYSLSPVYYEINKVTPAGRPGHTVVRQLHLADANFRVSERSVSKTGDLYCDTEAAYNGSYFQKLDHVLGTLAVSKKPAADLYGANCTPLDQFGFLAGLVAMDGQKVGLDTLKSDTIWERVISNARYLGYRELDGRKVLSFEITRAFDPMGNIPCRYEIDLSPGNGFFPARWVAYTRKGERFQEYRVKEFGLAEFSGATFHYAKEAEGSQIGVGKYKGQTLVSRTWKTEHLSIAPLVASIFTIDPASARLIVNRDTQTAAPVSR